MLVIARTSIIKIKAIFRHYKTLLSVAHYIQTNENISLLGSLPFDNKGKMLNVSAQRISVRVRETSGKTAANGDMLIIRHQVLLAIDILKFRSSSSGKHTTIKNKDISWKLASL